MEAGSEGEEGEVVGGWGGGVTLVGHFFVPPYEAAFGIKFIKEMTMQRHL